MKTAEEILTKNGFTFQDCEPEFRNDIITAMHEYAAQDKWIRVEDGLPEVGEKALCYINLGNNLNIQTVIKMSFLVGCKHWEDYNSVITHRRPLPAPPNNI